MTVVIDRRSDLTLDAARRVAWQGEGVALGEAAKAALAAGRDRLVAILEHDPEVVIYGVTTGAGQMAKRKLAAGERKGWAKMSPVGAAASWGDLLPERVVRAICLARLTNFVEGHAAVSPEIAQGVAQMLSEGPMPQVPAMGQGGAGEILSLSHLFTGLVERVEPEEKDVMCLINGSPSATALVTDAALAGQRRLAVAAEVLALSFEAFNAPLGHIEAELGAYWNNPHDAWALGLLRELIGGGHGGTRRSYQAPVSFRILPRMLGQAHRSLSIAEEVATESLQAVTDNPVWVNVVDAAHPHGQFVSTGGYHNPHAVLGMDSLTASYANLCVIAERHGAKTLDGNVSLLPDQLVDPDDEGGMRRAYMGCLPMAQTGYEEEARMYAQATLLPGSESGGFGQNDVASPVFLAWSKQERAGRCLDMALASLAPISLRALEVTKRPVPGKLEGLAAEIRAAYPELGERHPYGPRAHELAERFRARIYGG